MSGITRRNMIGATGALALGASLPVLPGSARADLARDIRQAPLERLDPFGPAADYPRLRPLFFDSGLGQAVVERLWRSYEAERNLKTAEWTFIYTFAWLRTLDTRERRSQVARAGRRMAEIVGNHHAGTPVGPAWSSVFVGIEAVTRGILNTLNQMPAYMQALRQASGLDSSYYYGLSHLLQAKLYTKAPPFPVSVGNPSKAWPELETIEPFCRGVWATWYLACAEAELQRHGQEAAFGWIARMEEIRPRNVHLSYDREIGLRDGREFRRVVLEGSYDKYTWDPVTVIPD